MHAYAIIWENNTPRHRAVKGHTWVGHAALNIGDTFDVDGKKPKNNYVSWWPGGGEEGVSLFSKVGDRTPYFLQDLQEEEYLPDHVITLEIDEEKRLKMIAAWKEIYIPSPGQNKYNFLKSNCSTIVSRVLHAGGFASKKWSVGTQWVWSPADIRVLVRRVGGSFMKWDKFLDLLEQSGIKKDTNIVFSKRGNKQKPACALSAMKARSGCLCTTGAPCQFQEGAEFFWKTK